MYQPYVEPQKDNTLKTIVGIGAIAGVGIGGYFLYDEWNKTKNSPEQDSAKEHKKTTEHNTSGSSKKSTDVPKKTTGTNLDDVANESYDEETDEETADENTDVKDPSNPLLPPENGILSSIVSNSAFGSKDLCLSACKQVDFCLWSTYHEDLSICRQHPASSGDTPEMVQFGVAHIMHPNSIELGIKKIKENLGTPIVIFQKEHSVQNAFLDGMYRRPETTAKSCEDGCRSQVECGAYAFSTVQNKCYFKNYSFDNGYKMYLKPPT